MDAKAPAAATTFQCACYGPAHLKAMADAYFANAGLAAAQPHLTPPSAI